jgi:LysW-gamma-L-lysine carboxypeptidase
MSEIDDLKADNLLNGLLELYSPSRAEKPAVEFLVQEMTRMGYRAFVDGAGNAVGELGCGENTLILLGHIDTVPGYIPVRRAGQLLYGRGSVDAKGPLAAFVCAAALAGAKAGWRVIVVGAVEEEAATSKGARYLLDKYTPDAVVIGEPSRWNRVTVGYKGRLLVDYELTREIGHTAGPEVGVCEDAFAFWYAVNQYADAYNTTRERVFDQLTPSLRSMSSADDGFDQKAALTIGFRMPMHIDAEGLQNELQKVAGEAVLGFRGQETAYHAPKNNALARAFIKAIHAQGSRLQFQVKSGTSDMNVVAPVWQCPIVAYGPGDSAFDHTPGERIDLQEYHTAINVLVEVIHTLCE